ncbi:MAG TPA: flagellar basal body-associated FliL family protein [Negativicutes bacterium]|nr:flagellar basal body-associated FliL family protein [Negativicutes bacterium]
MPDEVVVEEQPTPTKKPIFIYVIVGLVLVLALAGGTAYYVVANYMGGGKAAAPREPGYLMKLGDPKEGFIVNIGTATSGRYLKIGVILELKPDKKAQAAAGKTLSPAEIKIQDAVLHVLRSQRIDDYDPQKQDRLKELIKQEVNKALGQEVVYEVYITNLLLQ